MKKQLLGFAACALILSSCSQNQEIENYEQMNREEVRLAPYVNKTKASVMGDVALQENGFKVFAVQHATEANGDYSKMPVFMNNIQELWNTSLVPDAWSHEGKYYWPETDALSFFMVAPYYDEKKQYLAGDANANLDITQGQSMTLPVTIKDNVAEQIDILAASVLNRTKGFNASGKVDFTFKHILSRIGFAAKVKDGENLKFKITGISFDYGADIVKNGVFTFTTEGIGTMAPGQTKHLNNAETPNTSHVIKFKALQGAADGTIVTNSYVPINADDSYLMLMPQEIPSANDKNLMMMTLRYDVAVAEDNYSEKDKIATIAIPAMKYEQGKAYTYNLILSSQSGDDGNLLEVTFGTVGVENWVADTTQPGETPVE